MSQEPNARQSSESVSKDDGRSDWPKAFTVLTAICLTIFSLAEASPGAGIVAAALYLSVTQVHLFDRWVEHCRNQA